MNVSNYILVGLTLALFALSTCDDLKGYQVLRLQLETEQHVIEMRHLGEKLQLDFWKEPSQHMPTDVMVSNTDKEKVMAFVRKSNINSSVYINDVEILVNQTFEENKRAQFSSKLKRSISHNIESHFLTHSQINSWIKTMVRKYKFCSSFSLGKSFEKRNMKVLRISTGKGKPVVFIDAGIHAREWMAPASIIYLTNKLIVQYASGDQLAKSILDKYEIQVLPSANPDGYDYSHRSPQTRLWRKTRQPYGNCFGADPNRNFDVEFGGIGTSSDPCSDIYRGPRAFSEPETANIRDHFLKNKNRIKVYITAHAYGQLWFFPYGYTKRNAPNHVELRRIGEIGAEAIKRTNGLQFTVGTPAQILYESSGGSDDWAYEKVGLKYSFTIEVRPTFDNKYGFMVPVRWIKPSGEEMYNGIVAALKAIQLS